jgi:hypothetical protein
VPACKQLKLSKSDKAPPAAVATARDTIIITQSDSASDKCRNSFDRPSHVDESDAGISTCYTNSQTSEEVQRISCTDYKRI